LIAVIEGASNPRLEISHQDLRKQVCDQMAKMEARWGDFHCFRMFGDYVEYLRRVDHGWGDDLTLQLMAEMLVRPIHIINDHVLESHAYVTKNPPDFISEKCWRPRIVIAHYAQHLVISPRPTNLV